ncbi:MAG: hypothetical protein ACYS8Z_21970, partial [Planctomycetota bacterium]|jgi:hypothetical protein
VSEDLDQLKELSASDVFAGVKIRIIDDSGNVVFEPPVRERREDPDAHDIADMLNAPIISLEDLEDLRDSLYD